MRNILIVLSFLLLGVPSVSAKDAKPVMQTNPFLQSPVNNGMTISWLTNYPTLSFVEYGQDTTDMERVVTLQNGQVVANNTIHHIRLNDLEPNTKYYYRAVSKVITSYGAYGKTFGKEEESPLYSFTTPPEAGADGDFTAVVFNDLHKNTNTAKAMVEALDGVKYDFVIFNGDCIDDPSSQEVAVDIISKFNDIVGASEVPVIYLRGNHEIRNAYSIWLYDVLQCVDGDLSYGSFSWGDTRFVLLDCGEDKPDEHPVYYGMNDFSQFREDQKEFLTKEVKSKEFKKAEYRVLVHHIALYGLEYPEFNPCYELWGEILNNAKVDCAINAHEHRVAFHPKGEFDNEYPVLIGGGPQLGNACVTLLKREKDQLLVEQINSKGEVLNAINL